MDAQIEASSSIPRAVPSSYGRLFVSNGTAWTAVATSTLGVSALDLTGVLPVSKGGLNLSSAPAYGQLPVGTVSGGYSLTATSSLGLPTFAGMNSWTGTNAFATSTIGSLNGVVSVTGWPYPQTPAGVNQAINSLTTAGTVHLACGTYPLGSTTIQTKSGLTLTGDGYCTDILQQNSAGYLDVSNVSNVKITNLRIDGSADSDTESHQAIHINNASDIEIAFSSILNCFEGCVWTQADAVTGLSQRVHIHDSRLTGRGNADVIGGGPQDGIATTTDVMVDHNFIYQDAAQGNHYTFAIDMVKANRANFHDNETFGSIAFGSEQNPHLFSQIENNTIAPANGASQAQLLVYTPAGSNAPSYGDIFYGNTCQDCTFALSGTSTAPLIGMTVTGNTINDSTTSVSYLIDAYDLQQSTLTGNTLIGPGVGSGVRLRDSTNDLVSGNVMSNLTNGTLEEGASFDNVVGPNALYDVSNDFNGTQTGSSLLLDTVASSTQRQLLIQATSTVPLVAVLPGAGTGLLVNPGTLPGSRYGEEIYSDSTQNQGGYLLYVRTGSAASSDDTMHIDNLGTGRYLGLGAGSSILSVLSNGDVGIGVASPSNPLQVNGLAQIGAGCTNDLELDSGNTATYVKCIGANTVALIGNNDNTKANLQLGTSATSTIYGANGLIGIATTTPGSLFSIGGVANFTAATSTFYSTGGINLAAGCFAVGGNCLSLSNLGGTVNLSTQAAGTLQAAQFPALTGDVTTSAGSLATALKSTGTAGTYRSVTTDAQGRVTAGTNPTTFAGYGISDSSANLAAAITDETGTGSLVFNASPTFAGTAAFAAGTFSSTLGVTGLSTLSGGFLSLASSTVNGTLTASALLVSTSTQYGTSELTIGSFSDANAQVAVGRLIFGTPSWDTSQMYIGIAASAQSTLNYIMKSASPAVIFNSPYPSGTISFRSNGTTFFQYNGTNSVFSNGNIGVGTSTPTYTLDLYGGGLRLAPGGASQPTCTGTARGLFWVTNGATGVKDAVQVCAKDASDAYAWRTIY